VLPLCAATQTFSMCIAVLLTHVMYGNAFVGARTSTSAVLLRLSEEEAAAVGGTFLWIYTNSEVFLLKLALFTH
jgi:hypothetical protein